MPQDGAAYAAGTAIGNGTVVALTNSTTFNIGGLSNATNYYYFVFAANNNACAGGPNYNASGPLTGNATTSSPSCEVPTIASELVLSSTANSVSGSFVPSSFATDYLVIISADTITQTPVNGTAYIPVSYTHLTLPTICSL